MTQTQADKDRRLIEWLSRYKRDIYLYDLEEEAFKDMTYAEYGQYQEWERDYDTVGEVLDHLEAQR